MQVLRSHDNEYKSHKKSLNNMIKQTSLNMTAHKYELIPQRNVEFNFDKLMRTRSQRHKCKSHEKENQ